MTKNAIAIDIAGKTRVLPAPPVDDLDAFSRPSRIIWMQLLAMEEGIRRFPEHHHRAMAVILAHTMVHLEEQTAAFWLRAAHRAVQDRWPRATIISLAELADWNVSFIH